jgi:hypothetical protein
MWRALFAQNHSHFILPELPGEKAGLFAANPRAFSLTLRPLWVFRCYPCPETACGYLGFSGLNPDFALEIHKRLTRCKSICMAQLIKTAISKFLWEGKPN